jgi:hypothetical protein
MTAETYTPAIVRLTGTIDHAEVRVEPRPADQRSVPVLSIELHDVGPGKHACTPATATRN